MLSSAEDLVSSSRKQFPLLAHTTYHLTAVVRHIGGPDSGHYIVYRRVASMIEKRKGAGRAGTGPPMAESESTASLSSCESATVSSGTTGNSPTAQPSSPPLEPQHWVRVSDANVEIVDEDEVLDCEAYMLFYMRGDAAKNGNTRALVVPPWRDEEEQYWYPLITPVS
jgi:Ubiquitin carboxyl-terminal hydrolase